MANIGSVDIDVGADLTGFRKSLDEQARRIIKRADKGLPDIDVEVNVSNAKLRAEIKKLQSDITKTNKMKVKGLAAVAAKENRLAILRATVAQKQLGIDRNIAKAEDDRSKAVQKLIGDQRRLGEEMAKSVRLKAQIEVDQSRLAADLAGIKAAVGRLGGLKIRTEIEKESALASLAALEAKLAKAGADIKLKVGVDRDNALAEIAVLKKDIEKTKVKIDVDHAKSLGLFVKFGKAVRKVFSRFAADPQRALITAAAILAPIIIELGIAASGAALGLGAMAVASGVLAVGLFEVVKNGSAVGRQLTTQFSLAKTSVQELGAAMAEGAAPGLATALAHIASATGSVDGQTGKLSQQFKILGPIIGGIVEDLTKGLVNLLIRMEPLTLRVAAAVANMAQSFSDWASGGGRADAFVQRLLLSFDQIMPVLSAFGSLIGNIGGGLSGAFGGFAPVITMVVQFVDKFITHFRDLIEVITGGGETTKGFTAVLGPVLDALDAFIGGIVSGVAVFKPFFVALGKILQAFGALLSFIGPVVNALATFVGWVVGGAGIVGRFVKGIGFLFKGLSKLGKPLKALSGGFKKLFSGVFNVGGAAVAGAVAGFSALKDGMKGLFGKDGDGGSKKAAKALREAAKKTAMLNAQVQLTAGSYDGLREAMKTMGEADRAKLIGEAMGKLQRDTGLTKEKFDTLTSSLGVTTDKLVAGEVQINEFAGAIRILSDNFQNGGPAASQFVSALETFSSSADTAADRAELLGSFLTKMQGDALGNSTSMLAAKSGIDDVREALKKLGPRAGEALDIITDLSAGTATLGENVKGKALDNIVGLNTALTTAAGTSIDAAKRLFEVNKASLGTGGAAKVAADNLQLTYQSLLDTTAATVGSKEAAEKYLAKLGLIPPDANTIVELFGAEDQMAVLGDIRNLLSEIARGEGWTAPVAVTGNAEERGAKIKQNLIDIHEMKPTPAINVVGNAQERADRIKQSLFEFHDKSITLTVNYRTGRRPEFGVLPGSTLGGVPAASGGLIRGPGTGTSDSIPAWLSNKEFVIRAKAVRKYGANFFRKLNAGKLSQKDLREGRYANGGLVQPRQRFAEGGIVTAERKPPRAPEMGLPGTVVLRVGARDFVGYIESIADDRVNAADNLAWQGA